MFETLKDARLDQITEAIKAQIPGGKYVRCYNCAVTGELRIIVKVPDEQYEKRYIMRTDGTLAHKP